MYNTSHNVTQCIPLDNINSGLKKTLTLYPFSFISLDNASLFEKSWLTYLFVLNLTCEVLTGYFKKYCPSQYQTLKAQLDNCGMH
jgi:hypothetical protein